MISKNGSQKIAQNPSKKSCKHVNHKNPKIQKLFWTRQKRNLKTDRNSILPTRDVGHFAYFRRHLLHIHSRSQVKNSGLYFKSTCILQKCQKYIFVQLDKPIGLLFPV